MNKWGEALAQSLPELPTALAATRSYLNEQARLRDIEASEKAEASGDVVPWAPSLPGSLDPDVNTEELGGENVKLIDLACVVVRAFAPFRVRNNVKRRTAGFWRARWVSVLLSDNDDPIPVLLYAHHVAAHDELKTLFPETDQAGGPPPKDFPTGKPLVLRNLVIADGGARALAPPPAGEAGPSSDDGTADGTQRHVLLCSAPGTRCVIPVIGDDDTIENAHEFAAGGEDALDDIMTWWLNNGKSTWNAACKSYDSPIKGRTPSALCELHLTELPPLAALNYQYGLHYRPQKTLSEVPSCLSALHTGQLSSIL